MRRAFCTSLAKCSAISLVQVVIALLFVNISPYLTFYLVFDLQHLNLLVQVFQDLTSFFFEVAYFEQFLFGQGIDIEVGGNKIEQIGRAFDVLKHHHGLIGYLWR